MRLYSQDLLTGLLRWGYNLLYHQFAWMFGFAAWLVSAGYWNDWIRSCGELIISGPVLDIGCGQGILVKHIQQQNISIWGIDESPQMLQQCRKNLTPGKIPIVRGLGQLLPFSSGVFHTVSATFPAPFLFTPLTLNEIKRVLSPEGSLIILLTAECTGNSVHARILRGISRLFGFGVLPEVYKNRLVSIFQEIGFEASFITKSMVDSRLYLIRAYPKNIKQNL
jgi:ubiquinone/menaquinone biosynthesis C-methylase UbiE